MVLSQRQPGHELQLLQGSTVFFDAMEQAMDASLREIRLETYIFNLHGGGERIMQALTRAAQRGVAVFLVVDGVGTPELPAPWPERLAAAGLQWRIFAPLGRLGLLVPSRWRRLHRKLCVVDGQTAFCGGINVLDDGYDPNYGALKAPRFDFAVQVRGPLVQEVHAAMSQFWWRLQATQLVRQVDWHGAWVALQQAVQETRQGSTKLTSIAAGAQAELVLRDNLRFRTSIERAYRQALGDARHDILIANAYFLPGRKIRQSLIHAARRGVRVRLLLQGRYEYFMQYHAAHAQYGSLLAAGIEIYEYTPSFLHAKVAVVDGRWATVGSSNMDPLSLLLAREANVVVQNEAFADQLQRALEQAIAADARLVDARQHAARRVRLRAFDAVAYLLMRVMLFLNGKRY
ncbi:MAG: cardiolipin synthase ClsB [Rhodoferax sp.]|nr:cardiolipin synthase ClsB [Betaproteobacteria bacterium]NCN96167.1 cardiolipin synthase ClsB [Rhodoferax sp.]PIZ21825.1 MAG: cardiolipin synthase ClsB [Comamonadaceae bacterium CG_4_10_14_0_8_um_filter_57_29]PJC16279.1 MAG: cardiolipin synthase ClsB [Comamonadaceae bacterium CG_4_9_14_0_8_um_filter_57_21]NCP82405.1 cardiolipin synthase ClsB [Rhodoferax sp.]